MGFNSGFKGLISKYQITEISAVLPIVRQKFPQFFVGYLLFFSVFIPPPPDSPGAHDGGLRNPGCETLTQTCSHYWYFRSGKLTVVRQMPGYNPQRRGKARTLPKIFVLFYISFVLCRSVYCLCVNVYCTTAAGGNPIAVNNIISFESHLNKRDIY